MAPEGLPPDQYSLANRVAALLNPFITLPCFVLRVLAVLMPLPVVLAPKPLSAFRVRAGVTLLMPLSVLPITVVSTARAVLGGGVGGAVLLELASPVESLATSLLGTTMWRIFVGNGRQAGGLLRLGRRVFRLSIAEGLKDLIKLSILLK